MKILVLGGAGYIGSHTIVSLLKYNHDVICVDNLYNSKIVCIDRIKKITNKDFKFYKIDASDYAEMKKVFNENKGIEAIIVFAGYKAVGESVEKPLMYYDNNLNIIFNTLKIMKEENVNNIIFSSSATVYGKITHAPVVEDDNTGDIKNITNPYGRTKGMIEQIIIDECNANNNLKAVLLRYFNPIGADESGLIGEDPNGIPNNLVPYIAQVAIGKRDKVHVFGNDYNTKDGTGVRDYIHVSDLADGHVLSLKCFNDNISTNYNDNKNVYVYNLGTGIGYSVLEVIDAYEKVSGKKIPYVIDGRRPGDIDTLYCEPKKAEKEIGFIAKRDLKDMCFTSYNFQNKNPNGYE